MRSRLSLRHGRRWFKTVFTMASIVWIVSVTDDTKDYWFSIFTIELVGFTF